MSKAAVATKRTAAAPPTRFAGFADRNARFFAKGSRSIARCAW